MTGAINPTLPRITATAIWCGVLMLPCHSQEGAKPAMLGTMRAESILILGNSVTLHGPAEQLGWPHHCGMAASSPEKDYVHLLAAAIDALVEDPGLLRDLGLRARETVEAAFTWDGCGRATLAGSSTRPRGALTRRPQDDRDGVTWIPGALDDRTSLAELAAGSDVVLHIAGVVNVPTRADFEAAHVRGDTRATEELAKL